ncbi:MAG TPA: YqcC family protein [Anaerolineae bacterium]|nr:YqcC family protein [Anaerolineae bacterium]
MAKIDEIETELKHIGFWQTEPLQAEQYNFSQAFAMDTMTFSQWLQFVFIPRVNDLIAEHGQFPKSSSVGAQAVREFDGIVHSDHLITLLSEFDALFH